jgi:hypothetical protein
MKFYQKSERMISSPTVKISNIYCSFFERTYYGKKIPHASNLLKDGGLWGRKASFKEIPSHIKTNKLFT